MAKTRSQAHGIVGKKGVLWWAINRIIEKKRPRLVFLENVDRLLKSPASQRGRDFAIILACLSDLGYLVEWRVANAADYGFPQRRRRVFVIAHRVGDEPEPDWSGPIPGWLRMALWLVVFRSNRRWRRTSTHQTLKLEGDLAELTKRFGVGNTHTPFQSAGLCGGELSGRVPSLAGTRAREPC